MVLLACRLQVSSRSFCSGRRSTSATISQAGHRNDSHGRRAVYGGTRKFQEDPYWRDYILFYEYFHGDNGAGLGASHQTGWTGIVARMMHLFATTTPEQALALGKAAGVTEVAAARQQPARA